MSFPLKKTTPLGKPSSSIRCYPRRKRLRVTNDDNHSDNEQDKHDWLLSQDPLDAYEFQQDTFWTCTTLERMPRPLPPLHVLATNNETAAASSATDATVAVQKNIPLLSNSRPTATTDIAKGQSETTLNNTLQQQQQPSSPKTAHASLEPLDDPSLSTLSVGQHRRFLQLLRQTSTTTWKNRPNQQREFQKLKTAVAQEQHNYQAAIQQYLAQHKTRFLLGFQNKTQQPATLLAQYASFRLQHLRQDHNNYFRHSAYSDKCCQILSLTTTTNHPTTNSNTSVLDTILSASNPPRPVLRPEASASSTSALTTVDSFPHCTISLNPKQIPSSVPLWQDPMISKLAQQHAVTVAVTDEILQAWLQPFPWMATANTCNDIVCLDSVPQPLDSPRDCLTRAFQEGLYQQLTNHNNTPQYSYTVWTFGTVRVLIRSRHRLLDANGVPIRIQVHLEYFPERGPKVELAWEKALWILDSILLSDSSPPTRSMVARVNPHTAAVLEWTERSIAHALAAPETNPHELAPQQGGSSSSSLVHLHWHNLMLLLQAIPKLGQGDDHLLCFPGRTAGTAMNPEQTFVSVHKPMKDHPDTEPNSVVSMDREIDQADSVPLGAAALQRCMVAWKWTADRVPFTFPIREETTNRSNTPTTNA